MEWLTNAPFSQAVKVAMRISVITAHRASVVSNMCWRHVDLETEVWTIPPRNVEKREPGLMKSGHTFDSKLPERLLEDSKGLDANRSNEVYVFSVDGQKPINAETLRHNFKKHSDVTTHGFRNTFKTWALNQDPPIDPFLVDRYVDHALVGLDRHYRRDDLFQQRAELAERCCAFVMGQCDEP